jgi:tripartite-type tricarboxylate transporter receptor subunit TctC
MIRLLRALPLALIACLAWAAAGAEDYPNRPVKIIVPFGAGGPADLFSRVLAQHLSDKFKQSFIIEDRPGAGSVIGTDAVAKSAPDGYTLLAMSNTHTTNESLLPNKPFQLMRDFVAVTPINSSDLVMVVHPSVPANNLQEFIALAKAKPGELNYASSGPGTPYHKGSGEARNSVLGGHVQMMFDAVPTMAENIKSGQVRALGVSGTKRSAVLPDVPTIAEAGVPGYESTIWLGLMAPIGTPKPVVDKLNTEIAAIMRRPDVVQAWAAQGAEPTFMTPERFQAFLRQDIEKWAKVVKISGARAE